MNQLKLYTYIRAKAKPEPPRRRVPAAVRDVIDTPHANMRRSRNMAAHKVAR